MDLVNLVMTVCLVASPGKCREEKLTFERRGDLMTCMFLAQSEIVKWSTEHPALSVKKWKCAFPDNGRTL
jgi:hypothetical protein